MLSCPSQVPSMLPIAIVALINLLLLVVVASPL